MNENSPKMIEEYFKVKFEEEFKGWKIENSKTALTLKKDNESYSFDVVICKLINNELEVIRRNGINIYTWNKIKNYEIHYVNLKKIINYYF